MIDIERILTVAVKRRLELAFADPAVKIDVEIDETLPAITSDRAVSVIPGGIQAGPYTTGMTDLSPVIRVFCVWRIRKIPRDRKRDVYLSNTDGLSAMLTTVYGAIHNVYMNNDIDAVADEMGIGLTVKGCRMVEPLRFQNLEGQTKLIYPADYGSNENQPAGMGRTITFGRARYLG